MELHRKSWYEPILSEVVCEQCGLAQPYVTDEDGEFPTSEDGITLCRREEFLGISCDGEYARTVEALGYVDIDA